MNSDNICPLQRHKLRQDIQQSLIELESQLLQRDRATYRVSWNLVSSCI